MLYYIGYSLFWIFFKTYFRLKVSGLDNVPETGAVIITSNHESFLDPPLVGVSVSNRSTYFMARDTLFKNRVFGFILKRVHSFPVNRGTGFRGGFNKALELLKEGKLILVFPEGTRSYDGKLQRGKAGAGMLIYDAKVPVIPCYVDGSYEAMPRSSKLILPKKICIKFGKPIKLDDFYKLEESKEVFQKICDRVMDAIKEINDEQ